MQMEADYLRLIKLFLMLLPYLMIAYACNNYKIWRQ